MRLTRVAEKIIDGVMKESAESFQQFMKLARVEPERPSLDTNEAVDAEATGASAGRAGAALAESADEPGKQGMIWTARNNVPFLLLLVLMLFLLAYAERRISSLEGRLSELIEVVQAMGGGDHQSE